MSKRIIYFLTMVFSLSMLTFTACGDDDDPANISLEKSEIEVNQDGTVAVKINQGNGDYKVTSASETVAKATVSSGVITVTGIAVGETTITVTDKENKSATIKVKVIGYAGQIAATYAGTLDIPGMGVEDLPNEIVLSKGDDGNLRLSIATLTIPLGEGMSIGVNGIAVNSVPVTKSGDKYILTETTENISITLAGAENAPIPVPVTVKGTLENGKLILDIDVAEVPAIGDLAVAFEGTKKAN